jgi:phenylpropionate dioxygenase-like ring-hydroxylating dioxygenase large terminal subunit
MLVRNSWYVAAWASEIGAEKPLGRTILNEPVVMFRSRDGSVAALEGRCAHRRMPLAHGKVIEDRLVCCYHGLQYDASGRCVRVPGQAEVPGNIRLRRYPAAERYGAVWLWMGAPDLADESTIFKCELPERDRSACHPFYFHVKANYLYLNDNLSDLLHQAYLHNPSFGGETHSLGETIPEIRETGGQILVRWEWDSVPVPGTFREKGRISAVGDGWNHSVYQPPSFYINATGFAEAGTGKNASGLPEGAGKLSITIYQLITPETERSTHFFKIVHCGWPPELLPHLPALVERVNLEDIWACEEQQRMEDIDAAAPMATIPTDRAVVAMRRALRRMYLKERPRAESDGDGSCT